MVTTLRLCGPARTTLRGLALAAFAALAAAPALAAGQIHRDVIFAEYDQTSSNAELVRRLLSPLAGQRLQQQLARTGESLTGQPLSLPEERFIVYVPPPPTARGYGLLVFVPPWQDARLPPGWAGLLDRFNLIFVSAARSGNDASPWGRREPLALLAAHNLMRQYPVDPQRVYVAGFSGGSRIALRLALGYPDVFRGAILNAGSDPIGSASVPLPPAELMNRFQTSTHLVYVTGEADTAHANEDQLSIRSLRPWCVFNVDRILQPHLGHEVATPAALARALSALGHDSPPDRGKLTACRAALQADLDARLQSVAAALAAGRKIESEKQLRDLDERFGGLASPHSLALASQP